MHPFFKYFVIKVSDVLRTHNLSTSK